MLVALPVIDVLSTTWPPQPGLAEWRYGTIGISSNYLLTPLMGVLFAAVASHLLADTRLQRVIAGLSGAAALAVALMLLAFLLDAAQVRQAVAPEAVTTFKLGVAKAAIKLAVFAAFLGFVGVVAWRAVPRRSAESRTPIFGDR